MTVLLKLFDLPSARAWYRDGTWTHETLYGALIRHAGSRPADPALRDGRRRLTWSQLREEVDTCAQALHQAGLSKGDRVAVWAPSRVEGVIVFLACARNGYVCCPSLHQNYTVEEIGGLLERARCRALFVAPGYGADARRNDIVERVRAVESIRAIFWVGTPDDRMLPFPHRAALPADGSVPAPADDPDAVVYLAFTSGTTGTPKGVMHSHNTLLANGRALVRDWSHDSSTVLLSLSPLSHHIATVAIEQQLAAGFELVLNDPPDGLPALDWIVACGATYVMGVPTHAIDLLAEAARRSLSSIGAVRLFYMAGSTIPQETARTFLSMGITPQNIYGMTENGSHQYTLPDDDVATIVETCGRAARGFECAIFDAEQTDRPLGPGEVGEIATRGPLLMLGYFDNQAATEDSFNRHGWFLSGDLGTLDERGCLRFVGRKKDLIIRGGHNIHPARIEQLAHRHPDVLKAAAFGIADERLGEKVCLAVIARSGVPIDGEAMLAHLDAAGLSKYDMPEWFLPLEAFPLTASGKVLKRELSEWVRAGRLSPLPVRWKGAGTSVAATSNTEEVR
ncbi:MAG TPA: class I adenylate-forming enzyme family protein [Burkholderiaceae bacterium]|nr:class I adenylate-forming enzyme family protein [Burkholderiaceae bacterium]